MADREKLVLGGVDLSAVRPLTEGEVIERMGQARSFPHNSSEAWVRDMPLIAAYAHLRAENARLQADRTAWRQLIREMDSFAQEANVGSPSITRRVNEIIFSDEAIDEEAASLSPQRFAPNG